MRRTPYRPNSYPRGRQTYTPLGLSTPPPEYSRPQPQRPIPLDPDADDGYAELRPRSKPRRAQLQLPSIPTTETSAGVALAAWFLQAVAILLTVTVVVFVLAVGYEGMLSVWRFVIGL